MNEAEKFDDIIKKAKTREEEDGIDYASDEDDDMGSNNNNSDDEEEKEEKKKKFEHKAKRNKSRAIGRMDNDGFSNMMYQQQKPKGSKYL